MTRPAALHRLQAAALALAAAGATALAAAPAHADDYVQNCINVVGNQYTLCVSYNYTSRTAAANIQRHGSTQTVDLQLEQYAGGPVLASGRKSLSDGQWLGIFKSGVNYGHYCAKSLIAASRVCL